MAEDAATTLSRKYRQRESQPTASHDIQALRDRDIAQSHPTGVAISLPCDGFAAYQIDRMQRTVLFLRQPLDLVVCQPARRGTAAWIWALCGWANAVREHREPVSPANAFVATERAASAVVYAALDGYRRLRDAWSEQLFTLVYGTG